VHRGIVGNVRSSLGSIVSVVEVAHAIVVGPSSGIHIDIVNDVEFYVVVGPAVSFRKVLVVFVIF
jgi:hypothetical protein